MTEQELYEQYGKIPLHFTYYYKYFFTFKNDDGRLRVEVGGMSDEIYRFEVIAEHRYVIFELPVAYVYYDDKEIYRGE